MKLITCVLSILILAGCSATGAVRKSCFHLSAEFEQEIGYCQAVRSGDTLHISGTAASGEMATAVRSVYGELKQTLEANGLGFADVVKETVYATDLDAFIAAKDIRKAYYGSEFPAATWLGVERLYTPSLVLEIELTAVYPH